MPFAFSYVCDLLQSLYDNQRAKSGQKTNASLVRDWFAGHRALLNRDDVDKAAVLSALLPEKRTDRVYAIQNASLRGIIGRAFGLGRSRIAQLARYDLPGGGQDLADCVEGILKETPNPSYEGEVTVEEIDKALHGIAASVRFSSPAVRSSRSLSARTPKSDVLGALYRRLSARDAKWFTRLVLKNYQPVKLEEWIVYSCCHPLLPEILKVQDEFTVALGLLREYRRNSGVVNGLLRKADITTQLRPVPGVKIGRQPWLKARSIKHCLDMGQGRMSCEKKYDGEYCQIHIDLSKGRNCIQIFSKSGKDSTSDRAALHSVIRTSLDIGKPSCKIKKACILEGELLVYSKKDRKILGFEKIRKHVSRSGAFIGTNMDSQAHEYEHLMIVYFDLLLVDDESLLSMKNSERFQRLSNLVRCETGHVELADRRIIDFSSRRAASQLRDAFASCITRREEGLVLKPDDPYFDFSEDQRRFSCCPIKLKKEYINKFGDVGDFAVIAARYDATKAKSYQIPNLRWTHFFIACLTNKEEVRRWKERPNFEAVNVVEVNEAIMKTLVQHGNLESVPYTEGNTGRIVVSIRPGVSQGKPPTVKFNNPPVFDMRCFSFQQEADNVNRVDCNDTISTEVNTAQWIIHGVPLADF
ncbi:DNA ligase 4 [Pleurostoma richardsiae]|uniref:DNA ligase 4 n=1 Tax=Pleurostoma richardsiae TaxID=41990 RepID=A0AA38RDQ1_9PEZI|nr:DNA ligase 4 [Pleurostoma richardsiae]